MKLKTIIKKFVPKSIFSFYHWFLAKAAAVFYGFPSNKLMVIGITGTSGKSTAVQFLGQMLEAAGKKVGWASTVSFKVGDKEWINDKKMTMLGRFQTQKLLRQMVVAGCEYAIVETSSQGVSQFRHVGINYDVAVLTNLSPEHIEAHGGFENYKKAKGQFFRFVAKSPVKKLGRKEIHKAFVVNIDNEHAPYFLSLSGDKVIEFGINEKEVKLSAAGSAFVWEKEAVHIQPLGLHNVYNAVCAASVMKALDFSIKDIAVAMKTIKSVPGRLEIIDEGQDFMALVDFAFEPNAMKALYETVNLIPHQKIIQVFGSCGGGRDAERRPVFGKMISEKVDVAIITNEDPYGDDPQEIINQLAVGVRLSGKEENKNFFLILDRAAAIQKAVDLAEPGDLILITGKGSEPVMAVADGKIIPWDDRIEARKAIKKRLGKL
ncbi:MAG: UDP-N-acetylmuramoyl-L-alanyl-D-glutamate--2,6-diaminopimelate ligase [Candidatus Uhrbacteria bacterium]